MGMDAIKQHSELKAEGVNQDMVDAYCGLFDETIIRSLQNDKFIDNDNDCIIRFSEGVSL